MRQSGEWIQAICRLAGRCVNVKKETRSEGGDANEDSEAATLLLSEGLKACTTMASSVFSTHGNIGVPESYSKQFMPLAPKILALDDGDRLWSRVDVDARRARATASSVSRPAPSPLGRRRATKANAFRAAEAGRIHRPALGGGERAGRRRDDAAG